MNDIQLVGVSGSPRKSATDYAVRWALAYAEERFGLRTHYFSVRAKTINYCVHCDYCIRKKKGCVHRDDLEGLYPVLESAPAWLLGSPAYHGHISAQLKAVLDRTRALLARDKAMFRGKVGAGIGVGGDRNGGQEKVLAALADFYLINEMVPVGGGAFGANFGAAVWSADRGSEGVEADAEGLKSIRKTVNRLARVGFGLTGRDQPS
jgi:multimeric flavodoxin WrbA